MNEKEIIRIIDYVSGRLPTNETWYHIHRKDVIKDTLKWIKENLTKHNSQTIQSAKDVCPMCNGTGKTKGVIKVKYS